MSKIHPQIKAKTMFDNVQYEICDHNGLPESDTTCQCAKKICLTQIKEIQNIDSVYHDADLYQYWEDVKLWVQVF